MIYIDYSLFAQIENDAFLSGTFKLEGNRFSRTAQYLKQYLEHLKTNGLEIPDGYDALLANTSSLVDIEDKMDRYSTDTSLELVDELAAEIAEKVHGLGEGESVLIPGGWTTMDGGHGMVYQFTRQRGGGYQFTVFNAGDGLEYHAKKSVGHKELYNPTKIWHVNPASSKKDKVELGHFIGRLLKPQLRVTASHQKKPMTSKTLYTEILPSISYIGGVEQDASETTKAYMYTGGQLSGTCSQRVLHQILKVNSKTEVSYQQFIFKFKHHALLDYAASCCDRKSPYTPAVADQIRLALENNLKILNKPGLFDESCTAHYLNDMGEIKQRMGQLAFSPQAVVNTQEKPVVFEISDTTSSHFRPNVVDHSDSNAAIRLAPVDMGDGTCFLDTMNKAVNHIDTLYSLEKLILALPMNAEPMNADGKFDVPFYRELESLDHFIAFKEKIERLIGLLTDSLKSGPETPVFNIMSLHLATLLADTKEVIAQHKGLPSFKPFTNSILGTFINNQTRNPFYATNHPGFDQIVKALQKRFSSTRYETSATKYHAYLKDILNTKPELDKQLKQMYLKEFGRNTENVHFFIQSHRLESLYMIATRESTLGPEFRPICAEIDAHLRDEATLISVINPFLKNKRAKYDRLIVSTVSQNPYLCTSLAAPLLPHEKQSTGLSEHKYAMQDSQALKALQQDAESTCPYDGSNKQCTANEIQLNPAKAAQGTEKIGYQLKAGQLN